MMARFDLVFSYWVFAWYLLYMAGVVTANPKFALLMALGVNILQLLFMTDPVKMLIFVGINMFIKVLPLYTLRHLPVGNPGPTVVVFLLFLTWFALNQGSHDMTPLSTFLLRHFPKS